jgi:hypothetical protein
MGKRHMWHGLQPVSALDKRSSGGKIEAPTPTRRASASEPVLVPHDHVQATDMIDPRQIAASSVSTIGFSTFLFGEVYDEGPGR